MVAETVVTAESLRAHGQRLLEARGVAATDAALTADTLVEADLRGVHSHGVQRLRGYLQGLRAWGERGGDGRSGALNPAGRPRPLKDEGAVLVMDGDAALGQVAAMAAMRLAVDRARECGVGIVALRNSSHCGALAYYVQRAAEARCIGFAITNAGLNMAPWGGRERLVGNNPLAYGIPTGHGWTFVLDMATSVAAGGKLDVARLRREQIPLGWALDAGGQPTTDPVAARQGTLLPVGGPKGYGLALALDVLAGVLSGGRFGARLGMRGSSQLFQALHIERFLPYDEFLSRMDQLVAQLHAATPAEGFTRVLLPGEAEHELRQVRLQNGLPIDRPVIDELNALADELGCPRLTAFSAPPSPASADTPDAASHSR